MKSFITLALTLAGSINAFQFNYYSDTNCNNFIGAFQGDNSGANNVYMDFGSGKYIGGVIVVTQDSGTDTLSYELSNGGACLWSDASCCRGAPDCAYTNVYPGGGNCMVVDQTVTSLLANYAICDQGCAGGKVKRNATLVGKEFAA